VLAVALDVGAVVSVPAVDAESVALVSADAVCEPAEVSGAEVGPTVFPDVAVPEESLAVPPALAVPAAPSSPHDTAEITHASTIDRCTPAA
jgi:hypothetical protein